ncbi:MAG: hypothetical protein ACYTFI_14710, partial [Planctomycetota bacterium]
MTRRNRPPLTPEAFPARRKSPIIVDGVIGPTAGNALPTSALYAAAHIEYPEARWEKRMAESPREGE